MAKKKSKIEELIADVRKNGNPDIAHAMEDMVKNGQSDLAQKIYDLTSNGTAIPLGTVIDGTRLVYYTFKPAAFERTYTKNSEHFSLDQQSAVRQIFKQLNSVTDTVFSEIDETIPGALKAHIRFQQSEQAAQIDGSDWSGFSQTTGESRPVVIRLDPTAKYTINSPAFGTLSHEIGHALGCSHPKAGTKGGPAGGDTPGYSKQQTQMSYKDPGGDHYYGPAELDLEVIRVLYPKKSLPPHMIFKLEDLDKITTLYVPPPGSNRDSTSITLNVTEPGYVTINMEQLKVSGEALEGGKVKKFFPYITSTVKDVGLSTDSRLSMLATGAPGKRMYGAAGDDAFILSGGGNWLQLHNGKDTIVLNGKSGKNNSVDDFNASDDLIVIPEGFITSFKPDGKNTIINVSNGKKTFASLVVENVPMDVVQNRILRESGELVEASWLARQSDNLNGGTRRNERDNSLELWNGLAKSTIKMLGERAVLDQPIMMLSLPRVPEMRVPPAQPQLGNIKDSFAFLPPANIDPISMYHLHAIRQAQDYYEARGIQSLDKFHPKNDQEQKDYDYLSKVMDKYVRLKADVDVRFNKKPHPTNGELLSTYNRLMNEATNPFIDLERKTDMLTNSIEKYSAASEKLASRIRFIERTELTTEEKFGGLFDADDIRALNGTRKIINGGTSEEPTPGRTPPPKPKGPTKPSKGASP